VDLLDFNLMAEYALSVRSWKILKRSWGGKNAWQEGGKTVVIFISVRRKSCSMENTYADM
jgi:hypothetical protein